MLNQEHAYGYFLLELGQVYPEVVAVDVGLATAMQTDLFREAFPDRYFNLGIAEQNAVSVASGLARRGFIPLVHSFSNFLARRAHDQIAVSIAWPGCNVKLIAGSCGIFDGRNGPSHTAVDDLAAMSALPGMMVIEPGDLLQTRNHLFKMLAHEGPAYFRVRRYGATLDLLGNAGCDRGTVTVQVQPNPLCTLVSGGSMLGETTLATKMLADQGFPIDLIHISILSPFDHEPVIASAQRTRLVVSVENHGPNGGYGDAIARVVGSLGITHERLALPNEYLPAGNPKYLLSYCRLDAVSIASRMIDILNRR